MFPSSVPATSRAVLALTLAGATLAAAGAATRQRDSVSQTSGSLGATTFLQNASGSAALQGEVAGSANTTIKIPFGVLGEYNAAGGPFGIGVAGISSTGYAVAAEAFGGGPSLIALSGGTGVSAGIYSATSGLAEALYVEAQNSGDGIDAYADSTGDAIYAYSAHSEGLFGFSADSGYSSGIEGSASSGDGVHGDVGNTYSGVAGINSANGPGVYGSSDSGYGLSGHDTQTSATPGPTAGPYLYSGTYGQSETGPGVYGVGHHTGGPAVLYGSAGAFLSASHYAGLLGYGNDGTGLFAYSANSPGAIIENGNNYPTLYVNSNSTSGGYIIEGSAGDIANDARLFSVDRSGNLFAAGTVTSSAVSRNPGSDIAMYAPQQSVATVEDFGSARLANGSATIPLSADFAQTMDASQPYMVFVTPNGDTRGLYVDSKSSTGFVVRETQGGRSNLAFDYRIVARPFGKHLARLPKIERGSLAKGMGERMAARSGVAQFDGAAPDPENAAAKKLQTRSAAHRKFVQSQRHAAPDLFSQVRTLH